MKCPACKMETPEELGYCDFCKEPFRRKPPPAQPPPAEKVSVPNEVMAKLVAAKHIAAAEPGDAGGIPAEFAALDVGERIPELPPVARKLAWAFLANIVFWAVVGLLMMMNRARRAPLPKRVMAPPPPVEDAGAAQGVLIPPLQAPDPPPF